MPYGVLVIEDEETLAKNIKRYLDNRGFEVELAFTGESGLDAFREFNPDIVLLDYNLPGMNGLEVLENLNGLDTEVKVILITGHGSVKIAVDAMKAGAFDYIAKPLVLREIKLVLEKAVGQNRTERNLEYYRERDAEQGTLAAFIGESPPIQELKKKVSQLLEAEKNLSEGPPPSVLITGETGVGKELVSRAIHFEGRRADKPFVEINCASIPAELLESELFGYERGAFTDAKNRKLGLVESAHEGTLFLDEIGEMDLNLQAKLLKLLEDRTVRRLGSTRGNEVDIRIVASTNRSLEQRVDDGLFRSDLYYRLCVVRLRIPPLRERGDDIVHLAEFFLANQCRRYNKPAYQFSKAAKQALREYHWPGNVREMRNVMEQIVLLTDQQLIEPDHLPFHTHEQPTIRHRQPEVKHHPTVDDGTNKIDEMERNLIQQALDRTSGNVTKAATILGISRDTLRYRIEKYSLKTP